MVRAADRRVAHHEAAHAVVAVRLRLPIVYTDIIEHGGWHSRSGRTRLGRGADADPEACAVVGAAGVVAEGDRRKQFWKVSAGSPTATDIRVMDLIATRLGVGDELAFERWATRVVRRARALLRRDGGAAWRRVSAALLREHRVSGRGVYLLVQGRAAPS